MAWFNVYGTMRQVIQDLVAPSLEAIQGKLEALDAKIDAMDAKFEAKIDALDSRIRILDTNVHEKWEQSLSIHERLAVIEAKLEIR